MTGQQPWTRSFSHISELWNVNELKGGDTLKDTLICWWQLNQMQWEHLLKGRTGEASLGSYPAAGLLGSSVTIGKGILGWMDLSCGLIQLQLEIIPPPSPLSASECGLARGL